MGLQLVQKATKEELFDREVAPLLEQIRAVCTESDIPFLAAFQLDDDRKGKKYLEGDKNVFMAAEILLPPDSGNLLFQMAEILDDDVVTTDEDETEEAVPADTGD